MKTLIFKICDKTNFIQEFGTVESKDDLIYYLPTLGYGPCLRKESTHYAVANLPESDKIEFTIWLKNIE